MKGLTPRLVAVLLTFAFGVAVSVMWVKRQSRLSNISARWTEKGDLRKDKLVTSSNSVAYEGVSFSYHPSLASEVRAETVPPSPALAEPQSKLEGVPTEHLAFTLVPRQHESTFWGKPEIYVWRLADYERALAATEIYAGLSRESVATLKAILSERPSPSALKKMLAGRESPETHDIPFLPLFSGKQAFRARVRYVNFRNGTGVMFLTQHNNETSLINNQGLAYVFQGLTNDGRYAVAAVFPVAAPFLPPDFEAERAGDFVRPDDFYLLLNESKEYQAYLKTVVPRLEALPPGNYTPNLTLFEELIRSLNVRGQF